jgi:plastocyanin
MRLSTETPTTNKAQRFIAVLVTAFALVAFACGDEEEPADSDTTEAGGGGSPQVIEVVATDFQFDTGEIEVEPGASKPIALQNEGSAEHSLTVEELDFEIEAEGGESAAGNLEAPDEDVTYEFFCEYHPDQMRGTLVVGAGGEAPAGDGEESEKKDDDGGGTQGGYEY